MNHINEVDIYIEPLLEEDRCADEQFRGYFYFPDMGGTRNVYCPTMWCAFFGALEHFVDHQTE